MMKRMTGEEGALRDDDAMPQGQEPPAKYRPEKHREGIGLCLSGGGFRAALFHLGALRRLNELGILPRVRTISSVSGGSIISAHLATSLSWPLTGPVPPEVWEEKVAAPFRAFTRKNLRTLPLIARFVLPWRWLRSSAVIESIIRRYRRGLRALGRPLTELPEAPRFVFCATDMAFGVNWIFERTRIGDYQAGYVIPPPREWTIAHAVGASSCFPPLFNPLPVRIDAGLFKKGKFPKGKERDEHLSDLRLTDGGNYDNMGLEPVWKDHEIVLVSDGGGLFSASRDRGFIRRLLRYAEISDNQARAVRKRWLIASFDDDSEKTMAGTYWGIGSARKSYKLDGGYSKEDASRIIARIRTDLDSFREAEIAVLENHGYELADAAIRHHLPELVAGGSPPLNPPHPKWLDSGKMRKALRQSGRRKLF
jgi:NTE family protein